MALVSLHKRVAHEHRELPKFAIETDKARTQSTLAG